LDINSLDKKGGTDQYMIAVKNLQNLNEILIQEELLQAIAAHYTDMVTDKKITSMLKKIIDTSKKNHEEILQYLKSHVGKDLKPIRGGSPQ